MARTCQKISADEDVDESDASAAAVVDADTADIYVEDVAIVDFANRTAVFGMDSLPVMVGLARPMEVPISIAFKGDGQTGKEAAQESGTQIRQPAPRRLFCRPRRF